jgi:hypothetical protein
MIKKLLLLFFIVSSFAGFSQLSIINDQTKVSVLTVDVAEEAHSLYGHTALRIQDAKSGIDIVYNYGMFDFSTKNFILKFIKGDLQYYAAAYPYRDFEYSYQLDNRSIYEQTLNISVQEKQALFEKLNNSLYSNERFYTYKFIDRNCTTKVIEVLNSVLENNPIVKKNIDDKTYRDILFPYAKNHFYQKLGINIIFGKKVDEKETTIFLPFDLLENLKIINYNGKPIVSDVITLFKANPVAEGFSWLDTNYSLIIILLLFVILNKKATNIVYFTALGIVGLLFFIVTFYSFHKEVQWNYNMLLFNPLYILLSIFIFKNNQKWIKKIALLCLISIAFYVVYMLTKIHLFILLPLIIATIIILIRLYTSQKLLPSVK